MPRRTRRRPTAWPSAAGAPYPGALGRPAQCARNQMVRAIPRSAARPCWAADAEREALTGLRVRWRGNGSAVGEYPDPEGVRAADAAPPPDAQVLMRMKPEATNGPSPVEARVQAKGAVPGRPEEPPSRERRRADKARVRFALPPKRKPGIAARRRRQPKWPAASVQRQVAGGGRTSKVPAREADTRGPTLLPNGSALTGVG